MTIGTETISGETYAVYATQAEADRLLQVRPELWQSWGSLSADDKKRYLAGAAIVFNEYDWIGVKVLDTQDLAWPRQQEDGQELMVGGVAIKNTDLPSPVEEANILYAANNHRAVSRFGLSNNAISEVEAATGRVKFYHADSVVQESPLHPYTDEVRGLLDPYLNSHPIAAVSRESSAASRSGSAGAIGSSETFDFTGEY